MKSVEGKIADADGYGPDVFEWITANPIDMGHSLEHSTEGKANNRYSATVSAVKADNTVTVTVSEMGPDIRVLYEGEPSR